MSDAAGPDGRIPPYKGSAMGDQAGRKHPPKSLQPQPMVFERIRKIMAPFIGTMIFLFALYSLFWWVL